MKSVNPEFKSAVAHIFDAANFIVQLGIRLEKVEVGFCEASLSVTEAHKQHLGRVHGGVISTLAGHTATGAVTSILDAGKIVVSPEFKINLLRAVQSENLFCQGQVLMPGNTLLVAEASVYDGKDASGKLVAKGLWTFMALDK